MNENVLIISFTFEQVNPAFRALADAGCNPAVLNHGTSESIPVRDLVSYWAALSEKPTAIIMGADTEITEEFLCVAPELRVISLNCAGYDHVDLRACERHGVAVCNVSKRNYDAVSDFAWGQILCLMRNHYRADQAVRSGRWREGVERSSAVSQKTLGIVGMGAIGQAVAKRAKGFDMRIVAKSTSEKPDIAQRYGLTYLDDEAFFKSSDIIVLCCPHNNDTHHMIREETIRLMKPDAYIINPSRGGLIDTDALYNALVSGRIAGAALDAFESEPLTESPLFALENVLLTPHIGGLADRQIDEVAIMAAKNCISMLRKEAVESKLV